MKLFLGSNKNLSSTTAKASCALLAILILSSCASYFTRKKCEATNWFDYGQKVALNGQRLDQDQFISQCRKAEAEIGESNLDKGFKEGMGRYCLPEQAYITGKTGDFFVPDMCGGYPMGQLKQKHAEGVRDYCQASNGVAAGASGRKYNNICPPQFERAFLPEFNKGRKQYLAAQIQRKRDDIVALDQEILGLENEKRNLNYQSTNLQAGPYVRRETRIGPMGAVSTEQVQSGNQAQDQNRREELRRQISDVDWKLSSKREEQRKLRQEIGDINTGMAGL